MIGAWIVLLVLAQTGPEAMPHLNACSQYIQRNAAQEAVKSCKTAVGLDPQSAAAHMLLGQAYLATVSVSMVAEAKAEFQQALDINPDLVWARFYLSKIYLDIGRPDKAKEELTHALQTKPGVPHFLSLLGEAERKLGHVDEAISLHRKALAADPKMNTVHYYIALCYMDQKKDDEAIAELEKSIQSPYVAPDLYLTLGSLYAQRKRYQEAEALCRKAIALDPSRSEGYLNLGQLFNAQKMSDSALEALRQALPPGKTFGSSPYYQRLQADIYFERGRAYAAKGATKAAIQAFESSAEFDSGRPETHRRLSELYGRLGDAARATEHNERALKVGMAK